MYQENQLKHNESIMGEQIGDQEMSFVSSELDHNESVVDKEIDDRDLLLVKSQPELNVKTRSLMTISYCKWFEPRNHIIK